MRSRSKPVSFRVEEELFEELATRAEATGLSPGGFARAVLLFELQGELEAQLEGLRQEVQSLRGELAVLGRNLAALNENLRTALVALLVEVSQAEDTSEAKALAEDLIRPLPE
jgi:hypothetical protein